MEEIYKYLETFEGKNIEVHLTGTLTKFFLIEKLNWWTDERFLVLGTNASEKRFSIKIDDIYSHWINSNGKVILNMDAEGNQQIWIGLEQKS